MGALPSLALVLDYISEHVEGRLLREVAATKSGRWQQVSGRRLQRLGGTVSPKGGLIQAPVPSWLAPLVQQISEDTQVYGPHPANHVLLNQYRPGEGILPHADGPLYHPAVCILSLGSPAVMRFTPKLGGTEMQEKKNNNGEDQSPIAEGGGMAACSVVLPRRSLLVFRDLAYTHWLHGIDEVAAHQLNDAVNLGQCGLQEGDTLWRMGVRTSLTFRRVLKVHSCLGLPGNR